MLRISNRGHSPIRRWELNFLIGGYAYAKGTVGTDASVPLEDTEVTLNSAVLAYVRTLDL